MTDIDKYIIIYLSIVIIATVFYCFYYVKAHK